MKLLFATLITMLLAACASFSSAPDANQVAAIQGACAVDAGLRPTVTMLLAVPNLAKAEEIAAVTAARAIIDPICANPSASPQANTIAALTGASAQVVGIVTALQQRK